jgi:hypothetical protein
MKDARRTEAREAAAPAEGWLSRWIHKAWWLHSFFALSFGLGVMLFARKGLTYARHILIVLVVSWVLMFLALRFIVGPANRREGERIHRKGFRLITNYIIKQLYQQMFFFLVPLYASSATWSLSSYNWWLAPVLLVCAVLSTMDLVFDNVIMEKRLLAAAMYGLALFGVLNLMLPVVFGTNHFTALMVAAAATAPSVALLSFSVRAVFSGPGAALTLGMTAALVGGVYYGRAAIPPVPLAMTEGAVGHGAESQYECLPGKKTRIRSDQLNKLRCGSIVVEPGGLRDEIVHVWKHHGKRWRLEPKGDEHCDPGFARSYFPEDILKAMDDPKGKWTCGVETGDGQLVGLMTFHVVAPPKDSDTPRGPGRGSSDAGTAGSGKTTGSDAAVGSSDAGKGASVPAAAADAGAPKSTGASESTGDAGGKSSDPSGTR